MSTVTSVSTVTRVNGIELAYQVFGTGSPLVLLHGGFGSVEMFGPNVERLANGRRVIGVDLQSHGRSPAADRPMRFEVMADDIAALMKHLKLERAAIMGFSLGGAVALRLAIQHPERVERLVLVSTVFKRSGWYPEMTAGMDAMGPEVAESLKQSPMYEAYALERRADRRGLRTRRAGVDQGRRGRLSVAGDDRRPSRSGPEHRYH